MATNTQMHGRRGPNCLRFCDIRITLHDHRGVCFQEPFRDIIPVGKRGVALKNFLTFKPFQGRGVESMIVFERMARRHWEKYLPGLTKELKEQGIFEEQIKLAAQWASEELAGLVSGGAQVEAAKEIVLKEYILLPPEEADAEE
jgi:hypothetical protein